MAKLEDFLSDYFKIQRLDGFRGKSPLQWMTFSDWATGGKLNDEEAKWGKYLEKDAAGKYVTHNGLVVPRAIPAVADLSNTDWEKLYKICHNTWLKMNDKSGDYETEVVDFINDNAHFFDKTSFTKEATAATDAAIIDLLREAHTNLIRSSDCANLSGLHPNEINNLYTEIVSRGKKTYNTNEETKKKIQTLATKLLYPDDKAKLDATGFTCPRNTGYIIDDDFGWETKGIDPAKLADFQANYSKFLSTIQKDDKVFAAFQSNEESPQIITKTINDVKEKVDFNNDKTKIPEKSEDRLTFVEQVQKWASDTYEDYFKKYEDLRGHRVYNHSTEVHAIVKAIDKAEIKPTDGLGKIISSADSIASKLKNSNPAAGEAFEWFASTLKKIDATHSVEDALKNGGQMRNLVAEIIKQAAKDGKPETEKKAQIAMEVLMTIQYGNTTSATLDYLADEKQKGLFTLLSDKDYSWNKNEGMKFITDAMDKTMRWAFLGVGRVGAIIYNNMRKNFNRKFDGKYRNNSLRGAHQAWLTKTSSDRAKVNTNHEGDQPGSATPSTYRAQYDQAANIDRRDAVLPQVIGGRRVTPRLHRELVRHGIINNGMTDDEKYAAIADHQNEIENIINTYEYQAQEADRELQEYNFRISKLEEAARLHEYYDEVKPGGATPNPTLEAQYQDQITHFEVNTIESPDGTCNIDLTNLATNAAALRAFQDTIRNSREYRDATMRSTHLRNRQYEMQDSIDAFNKATKQMEEAQRRMEEREKEYNEFDDKHQDMYTRLMSYWDTLQDGRWTGHIGSAKRFQNSHAEQLRQAIARNRANYHVH